VASGLLAVAAKEFLHVLRDPATRFVFVIPIVQLVLFGYAIRIEIEDVPTAVVDRDRSQESRDLIDLYANTRTFEVRRTLASLEELESALVRGQVKVGLYVPEGFARAVQRGERAEALVLVDGSYSSEAGAAIEVTRELGLYVSRRFRARSWDVRDLRRLDPDLPLAQVDLRPRLLFNPSLRSANFFVPGLVGIILQLVTILLTAFAIVRERESGTFEQLMVTPLGPWSLLFGKLAPYALIGAVETAAVLLLMVHAFEVPIAGNVALLAALSALFLLTSLSLGLIVSSLARTQAEAIQVSFFILLPSILLSGFVFPLESIPDPIYPLTFLIPVRYFLEILRGIILRGAPFDALWTQTAALGVYTAALLALSALRFRRRTTS
jgi:ABC-type multidrug transport system permease subunit